MTPAEFKRVREAHGLTQQGLADAIRADLRTVQRWEYGERKVPPTVELLLSFLGQITKKGKKKK